MRREHRSTSGTRGRYCSRLGTHHRRHVGVLIAPRGRAPATGTVARLRFPGHWRAIAPRIWMLVACMTCLDQRDASIAQEREWIHGPPFLQRGARHAVGYLPISRNASPAGHIAGVEYTTLTHARPRRANRSTAAAARPLSDCNATRGQCAGAVVAQALPNKRNTGTRRPLHEGHDSQRGISRRTRQTARVHHRDAATGPGCCEQWTAAASPTGPATSGVPA